MKYDILLTVGHGSVRPMTETPSNLLTFHNPQGLHDPTEFGYSHTAHLPGGGGLVFVSGQYGSDPTGSMVAADFGSQVRRAMENLGVALAAHGLGMADVVQLRSYVVDLDFGRLGAVAHTIRETWSVQAPAHTLLGVAALATPEILYEVEAIAASSFEKAGT